MNREPRKTGRLASLPRPRVCIFLNPRLSSSGEEAARWKCSYNERAAREAEQEVHRREDAAAWFARAEEMRPVAKAVDAENTEAAANLTLVADGYAQWGMSSMELALEARKKRLDAEAQSATMAATERWYKETPDGELVTLYEKYMMTGDAEVISDIAALLGIKAASMVPELEEGRKVYISNKRENALDAILDKLLLPSACASWLQLAWLRTALERADLSAEPSDNRNCTGVAYMHHSVKHALFESGRCVVLGEDQEEDEEGRDKNNTPRVTKVLKDSEGNESLTTLVHKCWIYADPDGETRVSDSPPGKETVGRTPFAWPEARAPGRPRLPRNGEIVIDALQASGLSKIAFARKVGYDRAFLIRITNGESPCPQALSERCRVILEEKSGR